MNFKKKLAEKIICAPSFSAALAAHIPVGLSCWAKNIDIKINDYALTYSDCFNVKDWEKIQIRKLKSILMYAQKHVSYWREVFNKIGFRPELLKDFQELSLVPITTRQVLKNVPLKDLIAVNISRSRFVETFTSGSTGEPLRFFQDKSELLKRRVNTLQELRYSGFSDKSKILILGFEGRKDLDAIGIKILPEDVEMSELRKKKIYPAIKIFSPELLITTPSYLDRFMHFCIEDNFFPKFRGITYMCEHMNEEKVRHVENFFGGKIFSIYGTRECSLIGIQCAERRFHLAPWMNYVEIVDGRVIVTTFENRVMPFIRYDIGDHGAFVDACCACGRLSGLVEFHGRIIGNIRFVDGTAEPLYSIFGHIEKKFAASIAKFQLEQTSLSSLVFRYVPLKNHDLKKIENNLTDYFLLLVGSRAKVLIETAQYIKPNKEGKTPPFIMFNS